MHGSIQIDDSLSDCDSPFSLEAIGEMLSPGKGSLIFPIVLSVIPDKSFPILRRMLLEPVNPDFLASSSIRGADVEHKDMEIGTHLHCFKVKLMLLENYFSVSNSLIGIVWYSRQVFDGAK